MPRLSPERQIQRILNTIRAWETYAPDATFWRRNLAEFRAAMQPSLDAHQKVLGLRQQLRTAVQDRNVTVRRALQIVERTKRSVYGDGDYGPDSDLIEALGYTREAVRVANIKRAAQRKRATRARRPLRQP